MCGRFVFADFENTGVAKYFEIPQLNEGTKKPRKSYNIAPGSDQLTVIRQSPNSAKYMKWGFKPEWFKKSGGIINARSETIDEKPMFKEAFRKSRCLIPASGFYEWAVVEKEKTPYFIHLKKQPFFAFAGIYDHHKDAGGKDHYSFAILTTKANKTVGKIHDRMPVILRKKDHDVWLDKDTSHEELKSLFRSYSDNEMEANPVSRDVNSPRIDKASLIEEKPN